MALPSGFPSVHDRPAGAFDRTRFVINTCVATRIGAGPGPAVAKGRPSVVAASFWFVLAGLLFVVMALGGSVLKRLPLSTSLLYLALGVALGSSGFGLLRFDLVEGAPLLEVVTEIAVLVSLFTAGLKLRVDWRERDWHLPLRLATISMAVTIALVAAMGVLGLGLPLGAAILLGAILAPTDPVLASDVQVERPGDRDTVRFGLTGEAGLNDGAAFPFVMLGLGLLGLHDLGPFGLRWIGIDLLWATAAGLAVGAVLGTLVGRLTVYLRREHGEAVGLDEFLVLGLVALSYGVALLIHSYGFLAVFAAGLALRRIERLQTGPELHPVEEGEPVAPEDELATHPEAAPAHLVSSLLGFNEKLERIGEVALVVVIGSLLDIAAFPTAAVWFVPLLLLAIRPLAVIVGVGRLPVEPRQRLLLGWFGIRGIGSLYYLTYAIEHGVGEPLAGQLAALTLAAIAASVVVHGVSVTPLMERYGRRANRTPQPATGPASGDSDGAGGPVCPAVYPDGPGAARAWRRAATSAASAEKSGSIS
ncbi:MAG TPA: sodium:proton antiporter [Thermomicrobiales bacterium]|nr:sodium:proton antiporter [Thermomicrobiales bacterium]